MKERFNVQIKSLPISAEDVQEVYLAMDTARLWKEKLDVVVEWGTVSPELRDSPEKLSEYIYNTKLPITILGTPVKIENEIYAKVCKLMFDNL